MGWIKDICKVKLWKKYSQNSEEAYLEFILKNIGVTNKHFVDLGAWDGVHLSNTKFLSEQGWSGLLVDGKDFDGVVKSFITKENILRTLKEHNTPEEFDLLSIDLDGNDWWILDKLLSEYKPRLIISEFNAEHPLHESKTIEYNPNFCFDNFSDYYGYTYGAGEKLAQKHGYTIIFQNSDLNLYYLRNDLVNETPEFTKKVHRWWGGVTDKKWVEV